MTEVSRHPRSAELFARAQRVLPGGVGSSARGQRAGWVPHPLFLSHGTGCRVWDEDGHEYIDYLLGLGPLLLGHRPADITEAVTRAIHEVGTVLGAPFRLEAEAAQRVVDAVPSVEMVRFSSSGTEAVAAAVRLARAATGRPLLLRFEGMYHGWADTVYWSNHPDPAVAGPAESPRPVPAGSGLPPQLAETLVIATWNDEAAVERAFAEHPGQIAAIITEPVMCNTGCIPPRPGYLPFLREVTRREGALLIFDEVITGFRLALGGGQEHYGVTPDLTTMAKGLGGGFPVAAVGGSREVMGLIADGRYSHSGTYNSNVIQMAAVDATLRRLSEAGVYPRLHALGERLARGLEAAARAAGLRAHVQGVGPVLQLWFADGEIHDWREAHALTRQGEFAIWWEEMMARGIYFHPSQEENLFISTAHDEDAIDRTLEAARAAAQAVARRLGGGA